MNLFQNTENKSQKILENNFFLVRRKGMQYGISKSDKEKKGDMSHRQKYPKCVF